MVLEFCCSRSSGDASFSCFLRKSWTRYMLQSLYELPRSREEVKMFRRSGMQNLTLNVRWVRRLLEKILEKKNCNFIIECPKFHIIQISLMEVLREITAKYRERALLVPQYAGDEDMRRTRYHDMLRVNIREHVSFSACPTLDSMIAWAREREIDLSHNKLSGPLTNLPKIEIGQTLILANNIFNESIPKSLCRWTYLEYLDLSRNRLTGKIPKCLQNLQELGAMIFSSNLLSGVIPSYIALSHSSLHWLKLDDNNFIGLGNLRDLRVLDVGDNQLFGKIPHWIGENLTSLIVVRLHKNNFKGEISESLCKMSNLQILDVAYNNLTGIIPHCLKELNAMVIGVEKWYDSYGWGDSNENVIQVMKGVDLVYTRILDIVYNMDLSSNKLIGEIPVELIALSMLVGLNLSNNHLSGNIPDTIGNLTTLFSLDFSNNELTGMIPSSMAALMFLSHLNLSHNNLSGRIPTGHQLQILIGDPSIYTGNRDLCGPPLPNSLLISSRPNNISSQEET
uniref:Uncharacterized protein n=1 Tax=Lactuca sativa TaxID=4236 RepID=A0A9R1X0E4_LACSA|nr:hypothetical protein LSAT_V11C800444780 [Lactuca sativa]